MRQRDSQNERGRNKVRERERGRQADKTVWRLFDDKKFEEKEKNREEKKNITVNEKELYRLQMDEEENERMF